MPLSELSGPLHAMLTRWHVTFDDHPKHGHSTLSGKTRQDNETVMLELLRAERHVNFR